MAPLMKWGNTSWNERDVGFLAQKIGQDKDKFKCWTLGGYKSVDRAGLP